MGYYIQTEGNLHKAEWIMNNLNGIILQKAPESFESIQEDWAIICVVNNIMFEAAAFIYDKKEFEDFLPTVEDNRPRKWVLIDKKVAIEKSGYKVKR